jgi:hypothetical protein
MRRIIAYLLTNLIAIGFMYSQTIEENERVLYKENKVKSRTSFDYKFSGGKFSLEGVKTTVAQYDNNGRVLEEKSLKPDGEVRAIEKNKYDDRGNRVFFERQSLSSEYKKESEYDEIDNIIREAGYDGRAPFKTVYKYLTETRVAEIEYFIDDVLDEKRVYKYNGNNATVEILKRGQLLVSKLNLVFNERDQVLEEKLLSADGALLEHKKYEYNNNGDIVKEEKFKEGEMFYRIIYDYDSNNNLLTVSEESKAKSKFVKKKFSYDDKNRIIRYEWKRNPDDEYNIKTFKYESSPVCTEVHTFYPKTDYKLLTKYEYEFY